MGLSPPTQPLSSRPPQPPHNQTPPSLLLLLGPLFPHKGIRGSITLPAYAIHSNRNNRIKTTGGMIQIHIYTHTHIYTNRHTHIYKHIHIYTYTYMHTYTYTYIHICIYAHIYIHICIHINIII